MVEAEIALRRSRGHQMEAYFRSNDDVAGMIPLMLAGRILWSPRTPHNLVKLIRRFQPDVIHAHDASPLISRWQSARGKPVVQMLHNFRVKGERLSVLWSEAGELTVQLPQTDALLGITSTGKIKSLRPIVAGESIRVGMEPVFVREKL